MELKTQTRATIAAILLGIIFFLLFQFKHALLPFILATFLAYILNPLVNWMCKKTFKGYHLPRGLSVILVYIFIITSISLGGTYFMINLANEVKTLAKDIPNIRKNLTEEWVPLVSNTLDKTTGWLPELQSFNLTDDNKSFEDEEAEIVDKKGSNEHDDKVRSENEKIDNEIIRFLSTTRFEIHQNNNGFEVIPRAKFEEREEKEPFEIDFTKLLNHLVSAFLSNVKDVFINLLSIGQEFIFSVMGSLLATTITLMIAAFMIIDSVRIIAYLKGLVPIKFRNGTDEFISKLDSGLSGVVRGQLIICLVNGSLTGIGLLIFNIKFALILSIIATVTSLIPIFGVIISSVPIVLMALTSAWWTPFAALAWILGVHFIEGNFLNPKIMGKSAEIHPVLVIFALVLGEKTYGLVGALLAVPLFSILQTTFLFIIDNVFPKETPLVKEFDPSNINT